VNVAEFLAMRAAREPEGCGLGVERAGRIQRHTWRELHERTARFARVFADSSVRRGDRALVLAPPSRD
jgi:acyl-CoA synthetase (AMP-forming)/AMP-acid ligase II